MSRSEAGARPETLFVISLAAVLIVTASFLQRCATSEVSAVAVGFVEDRRVWSTKTMLVARLASGLEVSVDWDGEQSVVPGEQLVLEKRSRGNASLDSYQLRHVGISPVLRLRSYPDVAAER